MRHNKKVNALGRKAAHRKAMMANMAVSLIKHKRINTTVAKAKALRTYLEPLITKSKDDSTHNRRMVFSYLQDKEAVSELFREISAKVGDRPGGYTRILKTGNRLGDNADMCFIELVDYNETYITEKKTARKKTRRRGGSGKSTDTPAPAPAAEAKAEAAAPAEEATDVAAEAEVKAEAPEAKAEAEAKQEAPAEEPKADDAAAADAKADDAGEEAPSDEASDDEKKKDGE